MRAVLVTLGAILLLSVIGCSTEEVVPTPTATPVTRMSRIAFASNRDGNWEIYVMNADGTDQRNITNNPAFDSHPSWSPDGNKIAFYSDRDGNQEIYVMDSDGANQTRLTDNPAKDNSPAWSPDGKRIAFTSNRTGKTNIWIMDAEDGKNLENYTRELANSRWPAWSPDGNKLTYVWNRNVYIVKTDNTKGDRIIKSSDFFDGFFVGWPSFSPDGKHLALISNHIERLAGSQNLYTTQVDGYRFRRVFNTANENPSERPTWSPDGNKIAYASVTEDGDWDIFVVDFNTQEKVRLTSQPAKDQVPAWEPVGVVPEYPTPNP